MATQKGEDKKRTYKSVLDRSNLNHLKHTYRELSFEVLGGVNTESYMMLRVMLVIRGNRKTERDQIDLYNNFERTSCMKKVAERIGFSLSYVEEAFNELINELERYREQEREKQSQKYSNHYSLSESEQNEALTFLQSPNLLKGASSLIQKAGVIGNEDNSLLLFLIYLSRHEEYPLHAIIESKYHYLQNKIGELIPPEHKLVISHLSENALYYFESNELSHKVLLVEDTGTNKSKLMPLLDLQAKGHLSKTITQKDALGYLKTVQREVYGPICLSITTRNEQDFNQNAVLSFVVKEDNSKEQEESLMAYQRRQSAGLIKRHLEDKAKQLLWNAQRILKPLGVINPYAEQLLLPQELKNKQITNAHYLRFIETITFFKQYQRESKVNPQTGTVYIETTIDDIEEANSLLSTILIKKCDQLNTKTRKYFEELKHYLSTKSNSDFKNTEMHDAFHIPISTIKRYHQALLQEGLIEATGEGNRATGFAYRITKNNEFEELQKSVLTTLNGSLTAVKKRNGSPSPQVAQNQNGLPKTSDSIASR